MFSVCIQKDNLFLDADGGEQKMMNYPKTNRVNNPVSLTSTPQRPGIC